VGGVGVAVSPGGVGGVGVDVAPCASVGSFGGRKTGVNVDVDEGVRLRVRDGWIRVGEDVGVSVRVAVDVAVGVGVRV